jgi:hypothetical protein
MADGTPMWISATQMEFPWALVSSPDEATEADTFDIVGGGSGGSQKIYAYLDGEWTELGGGDIDLSKYALNSALDNYALKTSVPRNISQLTDDVGYAKQEDLDDLLTLDYFGTEGVRYKLYEDHAGVGPGALDVLDQNGTLLVGLPTVIVISEQVRGLPVTSIEDRAFMYKSYLKRVDIPENVTIIGNNAFYNCQLIESITLPKSLTSIGESAFRGNTALTDVYYAGTEEEWAAITIGTDNDDLTTATIHYNSEV